MLDDKARARIVSADRISPSGAGNYGVDSSNISDSFFGFGGFDDAGDSSPSIGDSDCEIYRDRSDCETSGNASENLIKLIDLLEYERNAFSKLLAAYVSRAVEMFSCGVKSTDKQILRRNVVLYLRNSGFNAAICTTKWENSGGLVGGMYEFIDVLQTASSERYLIDLDFAAEFEIARPTDSYDSMQRRLPKVLVGTSDGLKQIVKLVSDSARRSLKSRGLQLAPWRRNRFMVLKWLGPYRRTINVVPVSFLNSSPVKQSYGCRVVGFATAAGPCGLPATSRTR